MQKYSKKVEKKKDNRSFFICLRLFVCIAIVASAVILKQINSPIIYRISEAISKELEVEGAIEAISAQIKNDKGEEEVFAESESKDEPPSESFEDFYIGDAEKALIKKKEKMKKEEKAAGIETLSFLRSAEELTDDTAAEPFRIPPPSYCSYEKEKISFKYKTPLRGVVTSKFGYRDHPIIEDASFHTGLDIAAAKGTAIGAFAEGKVVEAGKNATYGNYLLIEHSGNIRSFYGHNSKLCVKKGQKVSLGQKIAEVGSTGMSTGPHLHFEIRKGNVRLDPSLYISSESV